MLDSIDLVMESFVKFVEWFFLSIKEPIWILGVWNGWLFNWSWFVTVWRKDICESIIHLQSTIECSWEEFILTEVTFCLTELGNWWILIPLSIILWVCLPILWDISSEKSWCISFCLCSLSILWSCLELVGHGITSTANISFISSNLLKEINHSFGFLSLMTYLFSSSSNLHTEWGSIWTVSSWSVIIHNFINYNEK